MSVSHTIDQSNYAVERSEAHAIDPELAAADHDGWVRHFRARAEHAEQVLEVQTTRANELEQGCSWLAETLRDTQEKLAAKRHNMAQENRLHKLEIEEMGVWVDNAQDYADDMDQGCSDLARRCQEAESLHSASHERAEHWRKSSKFWLEARNYHDGLREQAEKERDAALAELATLKAERKQEDETIGPVLRRALNQRDHYARERDNAVKSVLLWSAEADRAQREVISQAETILNLADVIHQIAACDYDSEKLFVPAELYQRLVRVAAEVGVK